MNRAGIVAVSAAVLAAVSATAACTSSEGGGDTPATSAPPATQTTAPTTTASTGGTIVAAGSGATATSATGSNSSSSPTQCAESQLRANATADDIVGLNRHVVRLTFTNTSSSSCTLTGFPGAAIGDASGTQVVQAKRIVGGPVGGTIERSASLTLRSGATAYAYLEGASTREHGAAQAGCDGPKYPRILVTPPNTRTPVPFTIGWPQCYSFDVHPVRID